MIMELGRKSLSLLLLDQLTEPRGKKKVQRGVSLHNWVGYKHGCVTVF